MTGDVDLRLWFALAAILIDAAVGDPAVVWQRVRHPVALMGDAIGWLDRKFNRDDAGAKARSVAGVIVSALILGGGLLVGGGLGALVDLLPAGGLVEAIVVAVFLAGRSLYDAVAAVKNGLLSDGLDGGRAAVAHIVGRNLDGLDEAGVARAGIESLAENFSDVGIWCSDFPDLLPIKPSTPPTA